MSLRTVTASLLLALTALAQAAPPRLQAEVRVVTGVQVASGPAGTGYTVPLALQARLDLDWSVNERLEFHAVATPTVAVGLPGGPPDRPQLSAGVEEAYLRSPSSSLDLDAGVVRWQVAEMRLTPLLRFGGQDRLGTPRGLLGVRATVFAHPWRVRLAAASPLDNELRPSGLGALVAARVEVGSWTLEAHGFAFDRRGGGLTASGTVGRQVVYAEAWLLTEPWEGRGGVGLSGYQGDWLWTGEAAWGPADGTLEGTHETPSAVSARPSLRLSASRQLGRDATSEAVVGVAWPGSSTDPNLRVPAFDVAATLTLDRPEAVLTVRPWWQQREGIGAFGAVATVSTFF